MLASFEARQPLEAAQPIVANHRDTLRQAWADILRNGRRDALPSRALTDLAQLLLIHREASKLPPGRRARHLAQVEVGGPPPRLIESKLSVSDIVRTLSARGNTFIVTDEWNHAAVKDIAPCFVARESTLAECDTIRRKLVQLGATCVVGVGGGIALDVAKAVAVDRDLAVVPTILSTNCVSTNRSVLGDGLTAFSFQTATPLATIVPLGELQASDPTMLRRWSQSGFGDLFAEISAAIDIEYRAGNLSRATIEEHDPDVFEALRWAATKFDGFKPDTLRYLGRLIHASGLKVLEKGTNADRIGGEHLFYKALMEVNPSLRRQGPTHGQIVAFASLMSAHFYGRKTGDMELFETMQAAFEKMRIPQNWSQIEATGCTKADFFAALELVANHAKRTLIGDVVKEQGVAVAETVYGPKRFGTAWRTLKPNRLPRPPDASTHPVLRDTGTIWNAMGLREGRAPYRVGSVDDHPDFHRRALPKTFHLPLKKPGGELRLPAEFEALAPLIQQAIDFEYSINPNADDCYILLTVDQGPVVAGGMQRTGGLHVDDFQWGRKGADGELLPKEQVDHSYLMSTVGPTEFFAQPVDVSHLDERTDSITPALYQQIDTRQAIVPEPLSLYLADGYCVHQAPLVTEDGFRTFVRVSFSPRHKPGDGSVNLALV